MIVGRAKRCASASGVSLHANVAVPARDRKRLERLCRYVARPPIATERLSRMADGRLLYRLKHRWRDGTTHVVFEPGELVEKLAALVPAPRFHLVRYHGGLGPCASQRGRVVPRPEREASDAPARIGLVRGRAEGKAKSRSGSNDGGARGSRTESEATPRQESESGAGDVEPLAPGGEGAPERPMPTDEFALRPRRLAWAELLRRVFAIDVLECPRCGARTRLLAAIHPPNATSAILACLDLPARAPPAPAAPQEEDSFDAWDPVLANEGA